jgi:hypothetical protein
MIFKVFVDQVNQVCLLHFAVGCDSHRGFVVIVIPYSSDMWKQLLDLQGSGIETLP